MLSSDQVELEKYKLLPMYVLYIRIGSYQTPLCTWFQPHTLAAGILFFCAYERKNALANLHVPKDQQWWTYFDCHEMELLVIVSQLKYLYEQLPLRMPSFWHLPLTINRLQEFILK